MELLNCSLVNTIRTRIDESKKLPNFSDYVVLPNEGHIWSKKRKKFIGNKRPKGYYQTTLYDDNGKVTYGKLHRIIYEAVNGRIPEGLEVNHIDEDKSNNRIDNLNLMTPKENTNWGTRNKRVAKALSKPVGAFKDGKLVMTFPSTKEASRNEFNQGNVASCCRGKLKSYKGYQWRYL